MRKHIFTLGLLLSSFCIMPIMADDWVWNGPTKTSQNMYTDKARKTLATEHCSDCCENTCWLPNGIYYNENGTKIIHKCSDEQPSAPTCNHEYVLSGDVCSVSCYILKDGWCLNPNTNGDTKGYVAPNGEGGHNIENINYITGSDATPSVSEIQTKFLMQWAVRFDSNKSHIINGKAACSSEQDKFDNDEQDGTYCWCQMTSPKKTNWVLLDGGPFSPCQSYCPMYCAEQIKGNKNERKNLLNNIQDDTQQ